MLSEVIKRQAIINFGTAGHVAHGKSTIVKRITGVATQTHKDEKERNITIRLGYANCKLFRNPVTGRIFSFSEETERAYDQDTGQQLDLLYQISFVDCPGHQAYISTMISGSFIMDYVLVVVAADAPIPQPQTHEHLIALDYSGIPASRMCFVLNKMDLVKHRKVEIKEQLTNYLDNTFGKPVAEDGKPVAEDGKPVERSMIPVSAATGENMDVLVAHLASQVKARIPKTLAQSEKNFRMLTVRSYNINRPNAGIELEGAVLGGTIVSGILSKDDYVEIRPGVINIVTIDGTMTKVVQPLIARVVGLKSGKNNNTDVAIPGGLVGVNLSLYAGLSGDDRLKGQVVTHLGQGDPIYNVIGGKFRVAEALSEQASSKMELLREGMTVSIIVDGIMSTKGIVTQYRNKNMKGTITVNLDRPVVLKQTEPNYIAIQINGHLVAGLQANLDQCKLTIPVRYEVPVELAQWTPPKYRIIDDTESVQGPDCTDFDGLAKNVKHIGKAVKAKLAVPDLNIIHMSTYLTGVKDFVTSLTGRRRGGDSKGGEIKGDSKGDIDMERVVLDNMARVFPGSKPRYNKDNVLVLDGRWNQRQLDNFVTSLVDTLLKCPSCRSEVSTITRDQRTKLTCRTCTVCGATTYMDSLLLPV